MYLKSWAIEVPEVRAAFTQARSLDRVEDMARSVISDLLEIESDSFEVEVEVVDPKIRELADRVREQAELLEQAAREARKARNQAAHTLADDLHLSYRDIGQVLGVSYQRVAQVLAEEVA